MDRTPEPTAPSPDVVVRRDDAGSRYELLEHGEVVGIADYVVRGDVVVFPHTEIRRDRRGQGLGAVLIGRALDDVRPTGRRIVPACWFVREFVDEHDDYRDLLAD
jgi:predicted GNAT family acetyltransferase